jgi:hypothetical protein
VEHKTANIALNNALKSLLHFNPGFLQRFLTTAKLLKVIEKRAIKSIHLMNFKFDLLDVVFVVSFFEKGRVNLCFKITMKNYGIFEIL